MYFFLDWSCSSVTANFTWLLENLLACHLALFCWRTNLQVHGNLLNEARNKNRLTE
ncbi:unnamed protein product [Tenebrio molitor]|nr:unnamed protein product [Tenebrio molitor]